LRFKKFALSVTTYKLLIELLFVFSISGNSSVAPAKLRFVLCDLMHRFASHGTSLESRGRKTDW